LRLCPTIEFSSISLVEFRGYLEIFNGSRLSKSLYIECDRLDIPFEYVYPLQVKRRRLIMQVVSILREFSNHPFFTSVYSNLSKAGHRGRRELQVMNLFLRRKIKKFAGMSNQPPTLGTAVSSPRVATDETGTNYKK
jgi:hypothetical protein